MQGILTRLERKALMPHILERNDLLSHLILCQLFPLDVLIFRMVGTVGAAVHTVVREVERRKEDDAVSVKGELDFLRHLHHLGVFFRNIAQQ